MPGSPNAIELLDAVAEFLAGLPLTGRDAFHAKVAGNVLAIVAREWGAGSDAAEGKALNAFRHPREGGDPMSTGPTLDPRFRGDDDGEVEALATTLSRRIRAGDLTSATPGFLDALIVATCARLAVDNPRYPTLARLRDAGGATSPAPEDAALRR